MKNTRIAVIFCLLMLMVGCSGGGGSGGGSPPPALPVTSVSQSSNISFPTGEIVNALPEVVPSSIWTSFGPGGGGCVTAVAVSPSGKKIFAGTDVGGLFEKTPEGWKAINNGLINYHILALAFDPADENIMYVGTKGGFQKSIDGGFNWGAKRNGFPLASRWRFTAPVSAIAVNPKNPNIVYAGIGGTGGLIYISVNKGEDWKIVNTGSPNIPAEAIINSLAISGRNSDVIYAATSGGLFKSTDGGYRFYQKKIDASLEEEVALTVLLHPQNDNIVYVTLYSLPGDSWSGGVYKSFNGGERWTAKNKGLNTYAHSSDPLLTNNYMALALDQQNPEVLYVGDRCYGGGLYWTSDGAERWAQILQAPVGSNASSGWLDFNHFSVSAIAVGPSGVYFGDVSGRVMEGVNTKKGWEWTPIYTQQTSSGSGKWQGSGLESMVATVFFEDPSNPSHVYLCYCDFGIFESWDGGKTFYHILRNIWDDIGVVHGTILSFVMDPGLSIAYAGTWSNVGQQGELVRLNSNGSWDLIGGGPEGVNGLPYGAVSAIAIDAFSPVLERTLYVGSAGNGIYKSVAGGGWVSMNAGLDSTNVSSLAWDSANKILYAGFKSTGDVVGGVFMSVNGGDWSRIIYGDIYTVVISPNDSTIVYVGARESYHAPWQSMFAGGVYKISHSGKEWELVLTGDNFNVDAIALDPLNSGTVFVGTFDHNYNDLANLSIGRGVFVSFNEGKNWDEFNEGLSSSIITFLAVYRDKLLVGTGGNGFFERPVPQKK